ncbi:MAG: hypothetical protein KDA80_24395, partial [Planctomycetaceae bacterium]|nr:hypothetical protein [Planctomycetaceae bacterium]
MSHNRIREISWHFAGFLIVVSPLVLGCANETAPPHEPRQPSAEASRPGATSTDDPEEGGTSESTASAEAVPEIPKISISNSSPSAQPAVAAEGKGEQDPAEQRRELLAAMMPVQVMLGQWRGTTQRDVGDFKALDEPTWIWDFQTHRNQPAMVLTSEGSPYFREIRLSYDTESDRFLMTLTDPEGAVRKFEGAFSSEPEEFQGDDQRMHVRYKLQLTQTDAESNRDQWQVTFNQQENNRYLLELAKRRGSNYQRFDTVATQRQGTSFAKSDTEYGERECII